jgi:hypothetical protein
MESPSGYQIVMPGKKKLPRGTTFYFHACDIHTNDGTANSGSGSPDKWIPPTDGSDFNPEASIPDTIWSWTDGEVTKADNNTQLHSDCNKARNYIHSACTIFVRQRDGDRDGDGDLLVYPHDVRRTGVMDRYPRKWHEVGFIHEKAKVPGEPDKYYNYVASIPARKRFCGPVSSSWKQLFTSRYRRTESLAEEHSNAGLTGELSVIIALARLSSPPHTFDEIVKDCIQPRKWKSHTYSPSESRKCSPILWLFAHLVCQELTAVALLQSYGMILRRIIEHY